MNKRRKVITGTMLLLMTAGAALAAEPDPGARTYVIRRGDTLAKIAYRHYGNGKLYTYLAEVNALRDPHRIFPGHALEIPPPPEQVLSEMNTLPIEQAIVKESAEAVPAPAEPAQTPAPAQQEPLQVASLTTPPPPEPPPLSLCPAEALVLSPAEALVLSPAEALVLSPAEAPALSPAEAPVLSEAEAFEWRQEQNQAFGVGERLTFDVAWKFVTVGSAVMEVQGEEDVNGRRAKRIVTTARSSKFFDNFFKVRDVNESWMDTESLVSLKFAQHIREGGYHKDETLLLDQVNRKFQIVESGKAGETPAWVQDVLSSMYYLRTKPLAVGQEHLIDAHSGDKSWPLKVCVTGRERIKTKAGEFDCLVVEPAIRDGAGIFQAKGKLTIWMTDDAFKIPVLMRSQVAVGAIEAKITEIRR